MLHLVVNRSVRISEGGDADDVLSVTWINKGTASIPFPGVLHFAYRDSPTTFVAARDREATWEPRWHDRLKTAEMLIVEPDGVLEPGSRVMAVRTRRKGLTTVREDSITFRDPLYETIAGLPEVLSVRHEALVLFPPALHRTVVAPHAASRTACQARFAFHSSRTERYLPIEAEWRRVALAAQPTEIDGAASELEWAIALAAAGDFEGLPATRAYAVKAGMNIPTDDDLLSLPYWERIEHLRRLAAALETRRAEWTASGSIAVGAQHSVIDQMEKIGQQVHQRLGGGAALPANATHALLELLQYQRAQRQSPSRWREPLKEVQFQERLNEFLIGRGNAAIREVQVAGGRADFFLGETPLELKVIDLAPDDPFGSTAAHRQQAAEYASARGLQLAILLILDAHRPDATGGYLPRPEEQARVDTVKSRVGVAGASEVAVITIVVTAFPPHPSALKD